MEYLIGGAILVLILVMFWAIGALVAYWDLTYLRWFNSEGNFRWTKVADRTVLNFMTGLMLCAAGFLIFVLLVFLVAIAGELGHSILH